MRRRRIEHWSNANYQGGELGKVLAGEGDGYDTVSSFFSEIFGASIRFFGDSTGHDDVVQHGDFRDGKAGQCLHTAEGRIVAALTMGQEDDVNDRIKELIRERAAAEDFLERVLDCGCDRLGVDAGRFHEVGGLARARHSREPRASSRARGAPPRPARTSTASPRRTLWPVVLDGDQVVRRPRGAR